MDDLKAFAKKKLDFPQGLTFGLRNKARYEIFSKLHSSPLRDTEEWKQFRDEIAPQMKLEVVRQSPLQKLYMCVRILGVIGFWTGLFLPLLFLTPICMLDPVLKKLLPVWRKLNPIDLLQYYIIASNTLVTGIEVEATGEERRIPGALLQMYNHGSFADPPCIGFSSSVTRTGALLWVCKKSLMFVPVLGQCIFMFGHLTLDRNRRDAAVAALQSVAPRALEKQQPISIAPEGTRSKDGFLQEFKKGAFHLRKDMNNCAILPVFVAGAYENNPPGTKFFSMSRVSVVYGDPVKIPAEETTEETRLKMHKMFLDMVPHSYTSTTGAPVSTRFFIVHLLSYILVFLHWKAQIWCGRVLMSLLWWN